MKFDRSLFIAKFAEEAREHLQKLSAGLLKLEQEPADIESTKLILRSAHTLKGSSRMLKFDDIGLLAHRMEDLLVDIRDGKVSYQPEIFDLLFACVDRMEDCLESIVAGQQEPQDVTALAEDVQRAQRGEPLKTTPRRKGTPPPVDEGPPAATADPRDAAAVPSDEQDTTEVASEAVERAKKAPPPPPRGAVVPPRRLEPPAPGDGGVGLPVPDGLTRRVSRPMKLEATAGVRIEETVRIGMGKLDQAIRLAGELVVNQMKAKERESELKDLKRHARRYYQLVQKLDELGERWQGIPIHEIVDGSNALVAHLDDIYKRTREDLALVERSVTGIQEELLSMRMLPVSTILDPFPRHVRELARELGKDVELVLEGEETELDKKILEKIGDAILHILRNAVDHGVEPPDVRRKLGKPPRGLILIRAEHESGIIKLVIEDDGAGLDLGAIRRKAISKGLITDAEQDSISDHELRGLIFSPDFSTAEIITDVSGRGVGLDVVKQRVEELKGAVSIDSEQGGGTKITITLPLTLASLRVLFVQSQDTRFAIPIDSVEETLKIPLEEVIQIVDRKAVRVRNQLVPLVHLGEVLRLPEPGLPAPSGHLFLVIAHSAGDRIGIVVDVIAEESEVVLKPLPVHLRKIPHVSGLTISGRNEIILVLHVPDLVKAARRLKAIERAPAGEIPVAAGEAPLLLVVDDSLNTREIEKSILEAEGYRVDLAKDGLEALKKAREKRYDLVVTDIEMPRLDGFSLTAQLREDKDYHDVPVVIVTSKERDEDKRRGIEVGANAYIVKGSFDQSNLIDTVSSLIG